MKYPLVSSPPGPHKTCMVGKVTIRETRPIESRPAPRTELGEAYHSRQNSINEMIVRAELST